MKKNFKVILTIWIVIIFSGCVSLGKENIEKGNSFTAFIGSYDPSIPLEEHSFFMNLADKNSSITGIVSIDGNNLGALPVNGVIILRPGTYNVNIRYFHSTEASAAFNVYIGGHSSASYTTSSANIMIENFQFEAGMYYRLRGGRTRLDRVEYEIKNINSGIEEEAAAASRLAADNYISAFSKSYDEIVASGTVSIDDKRFPAASVIKGIDAAVSRIIK